MRVVLSALVVASLTACATHSPDVIHPYEAQRMSQFSPTPPSCRCGR